MAIIQGHAMQSSSRGFYPKTLNGSLRFNDDDSAYLTKTFSTPTNNKIWTWSGWVKRNQPDKNYDTLFAVTDAKTFRFGYTGTDYILNFIDTNTSWYFTTNAKFRDPSAWYHIVLVIDTTQAVADDRTKLYVNGSRVTSFSAKTNPSQNAASSFNTTVAHYIGQAPASGHYLDGYLAEVFFIDGTAHTASDFGETKNGVWVPKNVTSTDFTMGTNGFHLTFEDDATVEAFNTVLYKAPTSNTEYDVTGFGFTPDLLWIKNTDNVERHFLFDSVRGVDTNKALVSNSTAAEGLNGISGTTINLNSDGFTINESSYTVGELSYNGRKYVAWGWDAGDGNPVSNTDGSITSTVKASTTNGFSIVSYTGTATAGTIGHGLSSAPTFIITKPRNGTTTYGWRTYHESLGNTKYILLNSTASAATFGDWNNTSPTSTVFSVGSTSPQVTNESGTAYIAYCWHDVAGVSKFGSYTGGTNGQKITTNFKVGWVLIKRTSSSGDSWAIFDNTRSVVNDGSTEYLFANLSNAEASASNRGINFLDDGFELVGTDGFINQSGTYIYAAFADTREAAFWLDQSSNNNDWQPVNLDHNDTVLDSPTDNYPVLLLPTGSSYLDGSRKIGQTAAVSNTYRSYVASMAISSGKWYAEVTVNDVTRNLQPVGIFEMNDAFDPQSDTTFAYYGSRTGVSAQLHQNWAVFSQNGQIHSVYNGTSQSSYGSATANGDTLMIALDMDNYKVWIGNNGTWFGSGNPSTGANPTFSGASFAPTNPVCFGGSFYQNRASNHDWNFGQRPFKYTPPA